ncbi:MAG: DNA primase [Planctomycetes bacterium]|nr:DNA primase [Planctomycetota bacterium]MCB9905390.1 DNA primase [Planctomycetota bacterium]
MSDLRRAIEDIKLRAPIEDVVRERVHDLKRAGRLWVACCPFHEERTPSFKVDPTRGTWRCYGACAEGGDQISFVERHDGLEFWDALQLLADRTGVELPRRGGPRTDQREEARPGYELLERVAKLYAEALRSREGEAARRYLQERGLNERSIAEFQLGWAPAAGSAVVDLARAQGIPFEDCEATGLARKNDRGRTYDFFRGRLMIPIRDLEGRVVGFGGRKLDDGNDGPKYVNTPDTDFFHKGRLVYGLDRALREVRRARHLVLVEGYTDVIAAHQAGLPIVGAVLGTSTTEDHAGLVRRTGARRISLVFDGDDAGSKAAARALRGLLPLDVTIDVVVLPQGTDPCDLLVRQGAPAFLSHLEHARDWFDFLCDGLQGLHGAELSRAVDGVLELLALIKRPVHRADLFKSFAARVGLPEEVLRAQWRESPAMRREAERARQRARDEREAAREAAGALEEAAGTIVPRDPVLEKSFAGLAGAILMDDSLVPLVRPHVEDCPDQELKRILEVVLELYEDSEALIDPNTVMTALGAHPARRRVVPLFEHAGTAESPRILLEGELRFLRERKAERRKNFLLERIAELEGLIRTGTETELVEAAEQEIGELLREVSGLMSPPARASV